MVAEYLQNFEQANFSLAQDFSSLKSFYQSRVQKKYPHQTILEAGCGRGEFTLWLIEQGYTAWGADRVAAALPQVPFIHQDLLKPLNINQKFDLIIDSHLFHCLVFDQERELYLGNLKRTLNPNGIIMMECLGKLQKSNPAHYLIQENGVMWARTEKKLIGAINIGAQTYVPFRRTSTVNDLEILAKKLDLKILELTYENGLGFSFENFEEEIRLDLVRVIFTSNH